MLVRSNSRGLSSFDWHGTHTRRGQGSSEKGLCVSRVQVSGLAYTNLTISVIGHEEQHKEEGEADTDSVTYGPKQLMLSRQG